MAIVTQGACVGVLYQKTNQPRKVHNGKLFSPKTVNTSILPKTVTIVHYTKVKNPTPTPTHKYLMKKEKLVLKPLALQKTPDTAPVACKNAPRVAGLIESGACIAVRFIEKGVEDVKNGRFLYAIVNGKQTCYVNPKKRPQAVVYEHMNLVKGKFVPQKVTRTGIQEVRRVTL